MRTAASGMGAPTSTKESASRVESRVKSWEKVMAEQVSDIPQAGFIAVAGSPWGASRARKVRAVLATMASPALRMKRREERSQWRRVSSAARSLIRPKAKLGAQVAVARK